MTNPSKINLDPAANAALMTLSNLMQESPEQLVDDAVACLVASRGMEDFLSGKPRALNPARQRNDPITWRMLEQSARLVDGMQTRLDTARDVLHRARIAKGRYNAHEALWSRLLLGLSMPVVATPAARRRTQ